MRLFQGPSYFYGNVIMAKKQQRFPFIKAFHCPSSLQPSGPAAGGCGKAANWPIGKTRFSNMWTTATSSHWKPAILPEQIVDAHRKELLGGGKKSLQNTTLKYYPYLLLDVKYPDSSKTREGVLLWGLTDGEMVLNTDTWESTHGFRDCLECQAGRNDFKMLQALAAA